MLTLKGVKPTADQKPVDLEASSREKVILQLSQDNAISQWMAMLREEAEPLEGTWQWETDESVGFWSLAEPNRGEVALNKVVVQYVERLLKALRKYEQLSIQMAKHFSPAQLGGYMEEMEELETFINDHDAWELEHHIKSWKQTFNLPDGTTPMHDLSVIDQQKTELTAIMVAPKLFAVMANPFPILNEVETQAVRQVLEQSERGWLLFTTPDESLPLTAIDQTVMLGA